ncbi:MAG: hypothetical protein QOI41_6557, partial [Myxococcales bacterium]|nr:hypothetical protein [Myxococcales bacterium]
GFIWRRRTNPSVAGLVRVPSTEPAYVTLSTSSP